MFNIGMAELVVVLLIAFLVVGPKDLPKVARWIARQLKALRRMLKELKEETGWNNLTADLEETKKEIDATMKEADITADIRDTKQQLQRSFSDIKRDLKKSEEETKQH
ncbi:MAG: Sec-independent protein translocase protein TatB [Clostridia bacterium]|nr:Sec-independent protein translocase protein TatB [Clostridia bacterium]